MINHINKYAKYIAAIESLVFIAIVSLEFALL